ncbi:lipid A biosynthesis lauroyl acyltransferase [Rhodoplanes roseus]|uniref:Lipid A biosynthesis lauroyl acyltransferase n=1 Tax=Rhodoplanes roseus TaxID=29409 RepID=A0A327L2N0_9BRAD|nr:lipid A biosynthesis lauroyl acyltransferase [Rhodoplanes roseus]RAI44741.1 lipid A biosynthesis lauroyl acyltransferase [Rhodoplanes roseus]
MHSPLHYWKYWTWRTGLVIKRGLDRTAGRAVRPLIGLLRRLDRVRASDKAGAVMRRIGPFLREHRIGRANLKAAFPDKSPEEIETILSGVWDNLGRVAVEVINLDRIAAQGARGERQFITYGERELKKFEALRDGERPAVIFTAHLANWELPAVVAGIEGLRSMVLYRRPNMRSVADVLIEMRAPLMGKLVSSGFGAPMALARGLEEGHHVGMLVDQHDSKGVVVTFFGRPCRVSPLIAMLARQYESPIHGVRIIRLPDGCFTGEITDAVPPVRDAEGRIDVAGTMQAITTVVESWVREYPEQWLWLHRRWR